MKQKIAFHLEAVLEVEEAIDWHESRGKGLGTEFLRAFEAMLSGIARHPESYPAVHGGGRRCAAFLTTSYTLQTARICW
jgi:hypothetical protein